jgi:ubiquitin-like protein ATG12
MDSPSDASRRNSPQPASAQRPTIGSHASSADAGTATTAAPIPDEDHGVDLPLTMAASVVLTGLPQDAHRALADAEAIDTGKGI